jgi:GNAT superfamily N-acetyltransferase
VKSRADLPSIDFRQWDQGDVEACVDVAFDAWPESARRVSREFLRHEIQVARRGSTWAQTVTAGGRPVGLIFGRLNRDFRFADRLRQLYWELKSYALIALGVIGLSGNRFTFLRKLISDAINVRRIQPPADGEITFVMLDPAYHGRGIGKRLVENFLAAARQNGAKRLTLVTDEESNWRFYEHLGWKRVRSFLLNFDSYLLRGRKMGFIYLIDLR